MDPQVPTGTPQSLCNVALTCYKGLQENKKALHFPSLSPFSRFSWRLTGVIWIPQDCDIPAFPSPYTLRYWWWYGVITEQKQWLQQSRNDIGSVCCKQKYTIFEQKTKSVSYILQKTPKGFFLQMYLVMCLSIKILIWSSKYSPNRI